MSREYNNIQVGPATGNLMRALRCIESARNYFYLATGETRGNIQDLTDHMTTEEKRVFDNARDMVEQMIGDNIRLWANLEDPTNEI